jgi:signal transduction histidine kinase
MARANRKRKVEAFRRPGRKPGGKKIAGLGRLLEGAAHDLRNPVSGIMSASEYLLEDAAGLLGSEHLTVLRSIESSSRQMLAAIDDMSEIAALETGKIQPDVHPKDIVRMIQGIVAQNRAAAGQKEIHIDLQADSDVPPVAMDSERVHRAVSRLVSMSINSAPEGAGIGIRIARAKQHVVIKIWTGAALRQDAQERRMSVTLSRMLIERVVAAHGGKIAAGSGSGNGHVFEFTLPLSGRTHRP